MHFPRGAACGHRAQLRGGRRARRRRRRRGTLAATEIIKEITGTGDSLAGRLLLYDAKSTRFETVSVSWDPANALSGTAPTILDLSIHASATDSGPACAAE